MTLTVPRRGDFDHQCVIGWFGPALGDAVRTRTPHGLVLESRTIHATFRDAAGSVVTMHRRLGFDWAQPLIVRAGGALEVDRDATQRSWAGTGLADGVNGSVHEYTGGGGALRVRDMVNQFEWEEAGLASVIGAAVGTGLQWFDPTPPGAAYASVFFRAHGSVRGTEMQGFIVSSQRYLPSGVPWAQSPYAATLPKAWTVFATEWDDGTVEVGHLCAGRRAFGFAMATDGCALTVLTTAVTASRRARRVRFDVDDGEWEWRGVEGPAFEPFETRPIGEGLVQRVGECRSARVWMGRLTRA